MKSGREPPPYGFEATAPTAPPICAQQDQLQATHVNPLQSYAAAPPQTYYGQPSPQHYAPPPAQHYGQTVPSTYIGQPPQVYAPLPAQHYVLLPPPPPSRNAGVEPPKGCFGRNQKNRPQMNVLSAATLIFVSGGMDLAWSIGFRSYTNYHSDADYLSTHVRVAWFIGGIIGAAVSCFLPRKLPKRVITIFCSLLVLISGIVKIGADYDTGAATLYLNGIANGLLFAPTLVLAGELSVPYMRGKISASTEQLSFSLGIFVQIVISKSCGIHQAEIVHGVLEIVYAFIALVFAVWQFIESPVDSLIRGRDQEAADALRRLQRPSIQTTDTIALFAEHKQYIAESNGLSAEQTFCRALPAFTKLCVLRALNAFSICSFIHYVFTASHYYYTNDWQTRHDTSDIWQFVAFGAARLLGTSVTCLGMDSLGRKLPTLVGLVVCSGLAFGIGSQFNYLLHYNGVEIMLDVFQFFAGMAFTASSAYLSEAYPLTVKQSFVGFTFIIEMLVFIIIAACDVHDGFIYAIGGIYLGVFILAIRLLPETRQTTLRQSQEKFKAF